VVPVISNVPDKSESPTEYASPIKSSGRLTLAVTLPVKVEAEAEPAALALARVESAAFAGLLADASKPPEVSNASANVDTSTGKEIPTVPVEEIVRLVLKLVLTATLLAHAAVVTRHDRALRTRYRHAFVIHASSEPVKFG
jgi:hypothetical protein